MHIASNPERFAGRQVGNGSCVLFVQQVSRVGLTRNWRRGRLVLGGNVPRHTIIATFAGTPPRYPNRRDGSSHAAVFLRHEPGGGIRVLDQWIGRPVAQRVIQDRRGRGTANNDSSRYWTVVT